MVDYSKSKDDVYDPNHGYNMFNYGHVGTFATTRRPSYEFDSDKQMYIHNGFRDIEVAFNPSETNAALAAITTQYYDSYSGNPEGNYENLFQIQQGNALRNGDQPSSVYSIWSNIGTPYNYFGKTENDQLRGTGSFSVNVGDHSISFGFDKSWKS